MSPCLFCFIYPLSFSYYYFLYFIYFKAQGNVMFHLSNMCFFRQNLVLFIILICQNVRQSSSVRFRQHVYGRWLAKIDEDTPTIRQWLAKIKSEIEIFWWMSKITPIDRIQRTSLCAAAIHTADFLEVFVLNLTSFDSITKIYKNISGIHKLDVLNVELLLNLLFSKQSFCTNNLKLM